MTVEMPDEARASFEDHDAFERAADGYRLTTTAFDATVTATAGEDWRTHYTVTVEVPTLDAAVADDAEDVGDAVLAGWLETFERRLADATQATRASVDLDAFSVERVGETVTVRYEFAFGNDARAVKIAKTLVEYVEGTYVEGVVPGYEYESPVTDLLSAAATDGTGERGGTPL